jgi:hypothetical protein
VTLGIARRTAFVSAAVIAIGVVAVAFLAAPRACKGGFEVYFYLGCIALVALLALPFAGRVGRSLLTRCAWALAFGAFGAAAWVVGLSAANVRFICGLGYL